MRWTLLFWSALACSPEVDRFVVVDGREGDYSLTEAEIPELEDPYRMRGTLGNGSAGGYIDIVGDETLVFEDGGALAVQYVVQDGVGVPIDADGLNLWSFYNTLSEVRGELDAVGTNVDHVFPVDFAYQPSLGGAVLVTSNAAYVGGGLHRFALLADPVGTDLPLAANPMVIRHEFGHALFQDVVYGGTDVFDETLISDVRIAALNEGFADVLATLALDDPDVLGASFSDPAISDPRRVDGDAVGRGAVPENFYERGTAYASLAWDLRQLTDPPFALEVSLAALETFAEARPWEFPAVDVADRFAGMLVDEALSRDPTLAPGLCEAHARRFPDQQEPGGC